MSSLEGGSYVRAGRERRRIELFLFLDAAVLLLITLGYAGICWDAGMLGMFALAVGVHIAVFLQSGPTH